MSGGSNARLNIFPTRMYVALLAVLFFFFLGVGFYSCLKKQGPHGCQAAPQGCQDRLQPAEEEERRPLAQVPWHYKEDHGGAFASLFGQRFL